MTEPSTWVTDTSVYTHLSRAGHLDLLHEVAPGGVIVVPDDVNKEIQAGRDRHTGITDPATTTWAQVTVLTDDEVDTQLEVKAALGGGPSSIWASARSSRARSIADTSRCSTTRPRSSKPMRGLFPTTPPCGSWSRRTRPCSSSIETARSRSWTP